MLKSESERKIKVLTCPACELPADSFVIGTGELKGKKVCLKCATSIENKTKLSSKCSSHYHSGYRFEIIDEAGNPKKVCIDETGAGFLTKCRRCNVISCVEAKPHYQHQNTEVNND